MVSIRCKMLVSSELKKLGIEYNSIDLGEAEIAGDISAAAMDRIANQFKTIWH